MSDRVTAAEFRQTLLGHIGAGHFELAEYHDGRTLYELMTLHHALHMIPRTNHEEDEI